MCYLCHDTGFRVYAGEVCECECNNGKKKETAIPGAEVTQPPTLRLYFYSRCFTRLAHVVRKFFNFKL